MKSATTGTTSTSGYSRRSSSAEANSVASLTSSGTKRRSSPWATNASSMVRVLSPIPDPSSITVSAPVISAISAAWSASNARSASVW